MDKILENIEFFATKNVNREELINLYKNTFSINYYTDPDKLLFAIQRSDYVVIAKDKDKLIALVRVISDGYTVALIQDLLILESYQGMNIGSQLLQKVLDKYKDIKQKLIVFNDTPECRHFFENSGFLTCDNGLIVSYIKFD